MKQLSKKTDIPLIQLTDDFTTAVPGSKDGTTYADLLTKEGIADIATYATGMGPWKNTLIPVDPGTNLLGKPTGVADMIHAAGLAVRSSDPIERLGVLSLCMPLCIIVYYFYLSTR